MAFLNRSLMSEMLKCLEKAKRGFLYLKRFQKSRIIIIG